MKSLEELATIRDKMKQTVNTREAAHSSTRIVVGMATCGIAVGARGVLNEFSKIIAEENLHDVLVTQTGCIGLCQYEPIVEVYLKNEPKVTYIKMTPERAARVVEEHIKGGKVIIEYTVGTLEK